MKRTNRSRRSTPPCLPHSNPTPIYSNPHLKPTHNLTPTLHAQAEAAAAKEAEMERKARAEHSRMQRAKAPEHPICAPCGKACADDEFPSARSSCASVPDAGGPAAIAAAAPALTHESPVAIESALEPLMSPPAPLPLWEKGLRKAQASSPAAAGYRGSGKTSCVAQMSDLYQCDEAACAAPQDTVPVSTDMNPPSF